ncbi:MAG: hypothetical protein V5B33_08435 [Candidatus Accumulibacter sp. UW20]
MQQQKKKPGYPRLCLLPQKKKPGYPRLCLLRYWYLYAARFRCKRAHHGFYGAVSELVKRMTAFCEVGHLVYCFTVEPCIGKVRCRIDVGNMQRFVDGAEVKQLGIGEAPSSARKLGLHLGVCHPSEHVQQRIGIE